MTGSAEPFEAQRSIDLRRSLRSNIELLETMKASVEHLKNALNRAAMWVASKDNSLYGPLRATVSAGSECKRAQVEEIADLELAPEVVSRASELARALVTARMSGDLTDFTEMLGEVKTIAHKRASEPDSSDFLTALIASLAMITAVMIRSAELSGLETDTGRPLLESLFSHLIEARAEV